MFAPLKPTAIQVIEGGGDCAYRARAFIALARSLGIPASKLALYLEGESKHAVALTHTRRGDYIVDCLYGVVYVEDNGDPIPLSTLADREQFHAILDKLAASTQPQLASYPRNKYVYDDARTMYWHRNAPMTVAYNALCLAFGNPAVDKFERPYFSDSPQILVIVVCVGLILAQLTVWIICRFVRAWSRSRRSVATVS